MIDKSLNQAPVGLENLAAQDEPAIEIEIIDPEGVRIDTGGVEIEIEKKVDEDAFNENLAEDMSSGALAQLAGDLLGSFDEDVASRRDWIQTYVDGLELLGMKIEERAEPWEGACGVYHPLLSEAIVKFQAETMMSTFPAAGPVKTQIIGKETPEKKEAAQRVQDDMNYLLTDEMTEYRPEHERMLWGLGLAGNAFKKIYFDPSLQRQVAIFIPAEDIVVPYGASNLESAERVSHVMRKTENELRRLQVAGFYRDIDLGNPDNTLDEVEKKIAEKLGFRATADDRYKIIEMHVDLDLEGYEHTDEDGEPTGIALPYVVTIEKGTQEILAIRRNWEPDDETFQKRQHFVHYGYVPGFGFYCFGLIHLVGAFAKSGTSLIRQLVDAGTLSNLPGGFKTRGAKIKGDDTPIAPGEFRDMDVPSGTMRDNIMPLPYKEPSQVLAALLDKIVDEGRRFASAADIQVSDMSANSPVGTTLAILERTLKTMSAIQARIHYSMKQEFRLLKHIIAAYTPEEYSYEPEEGSRKAKQSDYDNVDVIPVSDPNAATMAQKIVQYQAVLQLAQGAPQIYDMPQLHRQMLDVLGIKNAAKLIPMPEDRKPKDPVTENMDMLNTKPAKAFMWQDHDAHLKVHQSFLQDPKITQIIGQNPAAQQISGAIQAHIAEHLGFLYRKQMEEQLGVPLPYLEEDDESLPKEVEVELSRLIAEGAERLLQINTTEIQAQQAQQAAQDPVVQMQQQDMQIKQAEVQRKQQKDQLDAQIKQQQMQLESQLKAQEMQLMQQDLQLKQQEMQLKQQESQTKFELEAHRLGAQIAKDREDAEFTQQLEGTRIGIEVAKNKEKTMMDAAKSDQQAQIAVAQMGVQKANKTKKGD